MKYLKDADSSILEKARNYLSEIDRGESNKNIVKKIQKKPKNKYISNSPDLV